LWREGKTATAIAGEFYGVSRSAVLGKIFRMRRKAAKKKTGRGKPATQPSRRQAGRLPAALITQMNWSPAVTPFELNQKNSRTRAHRLTLFELKNNHCRWPFESAAGFLFCGDPSADVEEGKPYCELHMRCAYVPARRKSDQPNDGPASAGVARLRASPIVQAMMQRAMRAAAAGPRLR